MAGERITWQLFGGVNNGGAPSSIVTLTVFLEFPFNEPMMLKEIKLYIYGAPPGSRHRCSADLAIISNTNNTLLDSPNASQVARLGAPGFNVTSETTEVHYFFQPDESVVRGDLAKFVSAPFTGGGSGYTMTLLAFNDDMSDFAALEPVFYHMTLEFERLNA